MLSWPTQGRIVASLAASRVPGSDRQCDFYLAYSSITEIRRLRKSTKTTTNCCKVQDCTSRRAAPRQLLTFKLSQPYKPSSNDSRIGFQLTACSLVTSLLATASCVLITWLPGSETKHRFSFKETKCSRTFPQTFITGPETIKTTVA